MTRRAASCLQRIAVAICVLASSGFLTWTAAGPANACSCAVSATPEEAVSRGDAVFVGSPTEKVTDGVNVTYEFEVTEVFTGNVGSRTTVGTMASGAACGTSYQIGEEQIVFVSRPVRANGAWEGGLCLTPYAPTPFDVRAAAERVYGQPRTPDPSAPVDTISWWARISANGSMQTTFALGVLTLTAVAITVIIRRRRD